MKDTVKNLKKTGKNAPKVEAPEHEFEHFDMVHPRDWFEYTGWKAKGAVKQGDTKKFITFINEAKEKGSRGENIFFTENAGNMVTDEDMKELNPKFFNRFMFMYIIAEDTGEAFWMLCCKESVLLSADDFDFED